ncbi:response regulator transcription factor [Tichowtungia aerotolerans]|uniref:Response regulator n=1 Tax=Tichowtungia aerotolerans TaxID=2697043 RepID=A0A6P1MD56_9BACT|nr:response regulator transcription factor [Tichowtungia aerotolerans]QHI70504.1 response regulator [Tichowtungia aerotolerans]
MSSNKRFQVLIVDDHPVVRQGLHQLLNDDDHLFICGEATSAAECISKMNKLAPDMILSDISLPGTDGIELTKEIRQLNPNIPVLIFSIHGEDIYAERALSAGANGYVMKQENPDVLLKAIHKVLEGEIFLSPKMTTRMLKQMSQNRSSVQQEATTGVQKLSDRELEVFELIGNGYSTRRIADRLHLSIKTIETYRLHIKDKLNLKDAPELTYRAVHWVETESKAS